MRYSLEKTGDAYRVVLEGLTPNEVLEFFERIVKTKDVKEAQQKASQKEFSKEIFEG